MHVDAHRLYVHAGVDPEIPLDQQSEATLLWKRYPKGFPGGFGDLHVVHGHDNFPEGPLLYEGRTNLDTLAWRTGRLTIGVFDDETPGRSCRFYRDQGDAGRTLAALLPQPYWGFQFGVLGIWSGPEPTERSARQRPRRTGRRILVRILVVRIIGNTVVKKK